MRSFARLSAGLLTVSLLAAACGSSGDSSSTSSSGDGPADSVAGDSGPPDSVPAAFTPGMVAEGQVTIDDTVIDYVTVTPQGFVPGDVAPVLLAMPPGGQDLDLTRTVTSGTYATEAVARGWVVVSPAAPGGELYFNGSESLIPGLLDWMYTWVEPEGGRPHLAGVSNGGLSSFRLAALQPDTFQSILVFPGFPRSDRDKAALAELTGTPIRMFVGESDTGWVTPMEETFETLTGLGADVTIEVRPGEGHVIQSLSDGVDIFNELDALR